MGGLGGGAVVEGLTDVARALALTWDTQTQSGGEAGAAEVHFSAGNEALLLDCHAPPPPAAPRLELHLTMRTPSGPAGTVAVYVLYTASAHRCSVQC
jgi:hypothetical protein